MQERQLRDGQPTWLGECKSTKLRWLKRLTEPVIFGSMAPEYEGEGELIQSRVDASGFYAKYW